MSMRIQQTNGRCPCKRCQGIVGQDVALIRASTPSQIMTRFNEARARRSV